MDLRNRGKFVLIMGATGNRGMTLARQFALDGYSLVLSAREDEKLERVADALREMYKVRVVTIPADVSRTEETKQILDYARAIEIPIHMIVAESGLGLHADSSREDVIRHPDVVWANALLPKSVPVPPEKPRRKKRRPLKDMRVKPRFRKLEKKTARAKPKTKARRAVARAGKRL